MKIELGEILKIVNGLGGNEAHNSYNKGWEDAIKAICCEINKLGEAESYKTIQDYKHECIELKKQCDDLTCENKMLRVDRENEKEYSNTLESVLKAINLLTGTVTND